ncbi:hypothetical protein RF11_14244 [Thelohanellus kitauei]|uniref:Uncharacterized protein n=1 Tax=Thelohanellus kitauei TaxID=669202 RepID=A0A0C2IXN6_THEKT|nr:hypothetical protein RF11_14244 [Thelohanellus kitauei]
MAKTWREENNILDSKIKKKDDCVEHLKRWIAVKSVTASPELRPECLRMMKILASVLLILFQELKQLDCMVDVVENPNKFEKFIDGKSIELPPIILASYPADPNKKTISESTIQKPLKFINTGVPFSIKPVPSIIAQLPFHLAHQKNSVLICLKLFDVPDVDFFSDTGFSFTFEHDPFTIEHP